jgi:hypothetical protein
MAKRVVGCAGNLMTDGFAVSLRFGKVRGGRKQIVGLRIGPGVLPPYWVLISCTGVSLSSESSWKTWSTSARVAENTKLVAGS